MFAYYIVLFLHRFPVKEKKNEKFIYLPNASLFLEFNGRMHENKRSTKYVGFSFKRFNNSFKLKLLSIHRNENIIIFTLNVITLSKFRVCYLVHMENIHTGINA